MYSSYSIKHVDYQIDLDYKQLVFYALHNNTASVNAQFFESSEPTANRWKADINKIPEWACKIMKQHYYSLDLSERNQRLINENKQIHLKIKAYFEAVYDLHILVFDPEGKS
jgi:hypothetical protein